MNFFWSLIGMMSASMQASTAHNLLFQFDGSNFREWSYRVQLILKSKGLLKYLSDLPPTPVTDVWSKEDAEAQRILTDRINSEQLELVMSKQTAKQVFDEIRSVYESKNAIGCLQVKRRLLQFKFEKGTDPRVHVTQFEKLINEIREKGSELSSTDVISHFLLTLPEEFDNIVAYFDALPAEERTLPILKNRFIQEAEKFVKTEKEKEESTALWSQRTGNLGNHRGNYSYRGSSGKGNRRFSNGGGNFRGNFRSNFQSNYRGKSQNTYNNSENCNRDDRYRNFSSFNNDRSNSRDFYSNTKRLCFICKQPGHFAKSCPNENNQKAFFTATLLSECPNESTNRSTCKFYLDSGASDHMTGEENFKMLI
jgi:hypothetical protein